MSDISLTSNDELSFSGVRDTFTYGWREGNLNWPIRIQQAGKILLSWNQVPYLNGDSINCSRKGIYNSKNHIKL